MKKLFYFVSLILCCSSLFAQPRLRISLITGIPVTGIPNNVVYEANTYDSINVTIVNEDTLTFSDSLTILIKSHSAQIADTLVQLTSVSIAGGDSITLFRSNYVFSPVYFEDGDNIVVVWPSARLTPIQSDSLIFNLYFVSLLQSSNNIPNETIILFPNPATKFISINGLDKKDIKQVRIYDLSGKEVYNTSSIQKLIPIEDFKPAVYFIKIELADGSMKVIKFQKTTN